jgi:single-strand DNA-binding protein
MSGYNSITLIGNLGRDAELKSTSGDAVLNFSLGVSESWKDKSGDKKERTDWVNCAIWGKRAQGLAPHLKKGERILVRGKLRIDKVEKNGSAQHYTKVAVDEVVFLSAKKTGGASTVDDPYASRAHPSGSQDAAAPGGGDDDIPF